MTRKYNRTPISKVQLVTPEVASEPLLAEKSWMLSGVSSHYDLRGYFMLAHGLTKDASLGVLFANVPTPEDGRFQLELGVILPDLFPNYAENSEYCLSIKTEAGQREVCFSNVMARLRFVRDEHLLHALIPRRALPEVREGQVEFVPKDAGVELLRTFATCRFEIEGTNAEDAFETHCEICIHDLIERLNRVLKALPFVDVAAGRVYSMAYSRASLSSFYFIIKGASDDKLGHGWISPHAGRSMLNPPNLPPEQSQLLNDYLTGAAIPDEVEAILHSAQSYVDAGIMEYVLLLIVIAAEVATQRFVHDRLLLSQVSKSKLEDAEKDLTYSMMLNIVLYAVTTDDQKPDKDLVGKMNRARCLRNAYMHTGELPKNHTEVIELFDMTKRYVEFLRSIGSNANTADSPELATPDVQKTSEA
ncbi:MAG: hypothetical protein ACOYKN_00950 [Pirellula sp.]